MIALRLLPAFRIALLALALAPVAAAPAIAGPKETAYLQSLAGSWTGKGKISGENGGNVTCRLSARMSGEKLNFTGRCTGGSGGQSFSGTIRYNEARNRYESSSSGSTVGGKKSGSTLSFSMSDSNTRGTVRSTMSISPSRLSMSFSFTDKKGNRSAGTIPFRKG